MNRKEIYAKIKELGIASKIYNNCGISYTNLSNDALIDYIDAFKPKHKKECKNKNLEQAFVELVVTLKDYRIISESKANNILKNL